MLTAHIVENGFLLREEVTPGIASRMWIATTQEELARIIYAIRDGTPLTTDRGIESIK